MQAFHDFLSFTKWYIYIHFKYQINILIIITFACSQFSDVGQWLKVIWKWSKVVWLYYLKCEMDYVTNLESVMDCDL